MSSLSARHRRPFAGIYAASKAALDAMSESLADEVAAFGIYVTVIESGSFHTPIDNKFVATLRPSPAYPGRAEAVVQARNRAASDNPQQCRSENRVHRASAEGRCSALVIS